MTSHCSTALVAAALASLVSACSAATPRVEAPAGTAAAGTVTIPTESGNVSVPAGTGGTVGSGSGTTGPNEKEQQRGNTPPGTSRDGAGPAGGAIVDPAGAATGKR